MKKRLKKIPSNKFGATDATNGATGISGLDTVTGVVTGVGQLAMNGIQAAENSKQNGVTGGNTAKSTLSGLALGASAGSMFGPIGAGVGAAIGALAGAIPSLIGRKGSVDPITGEVTKGSGIRGRKGPSEEELINRSRSIRETNDYRNYNTTAAYDYYQDNGYNGYTMVANGGVIPNALAYVDDGELLRTPDGTIINIPEEGKPTDSNLVSVPEGTQVLSDKLKVPGTKQTFAEAGKKLIKKQKYGNDRYAQNSKMLNEKNNQIAYNNLLDLQEDMKNKKGIKDKVGKYSDGNRRIRNVQSASDVSWSNDIMPSDWYRSTLSMITPDNMQEYNNLQNTYATLGFNENKPGDFITPNEAVGTYQGMFDNITDVNAAISDLYKNKRLNAVGNTGDNPETWRDNLPGTATWLRHLGRNVTPEQLQQIQSGLHPYVEAYVNPENGMVNFRRNSRTIAPTKNNTDLSDMVDTSDIIKIPTKTISTATNNNSNNTNTNLSGVLNNIDPIISGISQLWANTQNARDLEPEQVPPRYTRAYFSPVEYNINPLLEEINRTNAITRYNQTQLAPRTGANLAYGIQSAVARNRAINEAYNNQRNINNQTRARNAQMAAGVSQYNAQAQHTADVENAQNRAQARNLRRQYRSANAAIVPSVLRDLRRNRRDQAILQYMEPYLRYGVTDDMWTNVRGGLK